MQNANAKCKMQNANAKCKCKIYIKSGLIILNASLILGSKRCL